jgi:hypothetical protein
MIGQFGEGQLTLHLIAVPSAISLLDEIAGIGQIAHNGAYMSLGNAELGGEISQADIWILRDANECPPVVGQEIPTTHGRTIASDI